MQTMPFINPFALWQEWMKQFGTVCKMPGMMPGIMSAMPTATTEPFAFSPFMQGNPQAAYMAAMQQVASFWQSVMLPAKSSMPHETPAGAWPFVGMHEATGLKPKVTVMTIELGDMTPYIKQASEMMNTWQQQWLQNFDHTSKGRLQ